VPNVFVRKHKKRCNRGDSEKSFHMLAGVVSLNVINEVMSLCNVENQRRVANGEVPLLSIQQLNMFQKLWLLNLHEVSDFA